MKPKSSDPSPQNDLFRMRLENLIDMRHELVRLSRLINWQSLEIQLSNCLKDSIRGAPGLPSRLVVGVIYLQHAYGLSDESVVARWKENPYWQYFCGEEFFQHKLPFHPTSLTKWRNRLGKEGCERLLQATIKSAEQSRMVTPKDFKKVIVDSTVQEKNTLSNRQCFARKSTATAGEFAERLGHP
jgi:IS5 family transposase